MPELLEQHQVRIDRAGARRIGAGETIFEDLDQLVAVTRRLFDQPQQQQAQLARSEDAAGAGPGTDRSPTAPRAMSATTSMTSGAALTALTATPACLTG